MLFTSLDLMLRYLMLLSRFLVMWLFFEGLFSGIRFTTGCNKPDVLETIGFDTSRLCGVRIIDIKGENT